MNPYLDEQEQRTNHFFNRSDFGSSVCLIFIFCYSYWHFQVNSIYAAFSRTPQQRQKQTFLSSDTVLKKQVWTNEEYQKFVSIVLSSFYSESNFLLHNIEGKEIHFSVRTFQIFYYKELP